MGPGKRPHPHGVFTSSTLSRVKGHDNSSCDPDVSNGDSGSLTDKGLLPGPPPPDHTSPLDLTPA